MENSNKQTVPFGRVCWKQLSPVFPYYSYSQYSSINPEMFMAEIERFVHAQPRKNK